MAQKQDNTGFLLIGGIFIVVLLLIVFKKPKYNSSGGGAGYLPVFNPNPNPNPNIGGGGGGGSVASKSFPICKGARDTPGDNRVEVIQNFLNRTIPTSLDTDGKWGTLTQDAVDTIFLSSCITEEEFRFINSSS